MQWMNGFIKPAKPSGRCDSTTGPVSPADQAKNENEALSPLSPVPSDTSTHPPSFNQQGCGRVLYCEDKEYNKNLSESSDGINASGISSLDYSEISNSLGSYDHNRIGYLNCHGVCSQSSEMSDQLPINNTSDKVRLSSGDLSMESVQNLEGQKLIFGPATLNDWLDVTCRLLEDTDLFSDLSTVKFVPKREQAILNLLESLVDFGVLVEISTSASLPRLEVNENIDASVAQINVNFVFEFIDIVNLILADPMVILVCKWRIKLLERIGGTESLETMWKVLMGLRMSISKKRPAVDDAEQTENSNQKKPRLEVYGIENLDPPLASSAKLSNVDRQNVITGGNCEQISMPVNPYLADTEQGPSGRAQQAHVGNKQECDTANTTRAVFDSNESESSSFNESSQDSVYDPDSVGDGFMFELSEVNIQRKVASIESGLVQVTLKKCAYSLGFEGVPVDLSVESINSSYYDEGYSNKYESEEVQLEHDETDLVFESGVRRAVGMVNGTESSKSIEKLLGVFNKQKGVSKLRCPPGDPSIVVKFDPNNKTDDTLECGQKIKENSPPSTGAKEADYGLQLCPTKQSDPEPDTSKDE